MNSLQRTTNLIEGRPIDHLPAMPIIMLWGAARYGHSYADYTRDHGVLCECQLRLCEEFGLDVLQLISDPVRETADCGAEMIYYDDNPPRAANLVLADKSALRTMVMPDPYRGRMGDRVAGAAHLREAAGDEYPIMGWVEGPIAEAVDLRGMTDLMMDLVTDIEFCRDLMDWVIELEIAFALAQIDAGCHMIGIGDAAASLVSADIYRAEILPREQRLVAAIREAGAIARLHICGNTTHILGDMAETGCEIIDLDHTADMGIARERMGPGPVLLGNFDPVSVVLDGTPDTVYAACRWCHEQAGRRYIVGPGCEVPPGTPAENVHTMVRYAHEAPV